MPPHAGTPNPTPARVMPDAMGCRAVHIDDPASGDRIALKWLYPADATAQPQAFGPYPMTVAMDAALAAERLGFLDRELRAAGR